MATRSPTRRESQERTESRLLDAAEKVFAKRGYRGATLAEVAQVAGYTTGAVYSNFEGKRDLFLAVAARQAASRVEDIAGFERARVEDPAEFEAGLRSGFTTFLERNPEWAPLFFEFWADAGHDRELRERFRAVRELAREGLAEPLKLLESRGGLGGGYPPKALAAVILAAASGIAFEHVLDPDAVSAELAAFALAAIVRAAAEPDSGAAS